MDSVNEQKPPKGLVKLVNNLLPVKTTDEVSGGVWGQRPHTFGEATLLLSNHGLIFM